MSGEILVPAPPRCTPSPIFRPGAAASLIGRPEWDDASSRGHWESVLS